MLLAGDVGADAARVMAQQTLDDTNCTSNISRKFYQILMLSFANAQEMATDPDHERTSCFDGL